jgi:hypothetical protein
MIHRQKRLPEVVRNQRFSVAQRLRQVMGQRSQCEWGRELGIPQQSISRYVAAEATPHMDFLVHIGRRERINLNWLVLGEGRMHRPG